MRAAGVWWVVCWGMLGLGCESGSPQTGSESHFLTACQATCGSGFECLCGVCTKRCDGDATCTAIYEDAECVDVASRPAASECSGADVATFCDVRCTTSADCRGLGEDFVCSAGFCRQGSGSTPVGPDDLVDDGRIDLDELCDFYVRDVCRAKLDCYGWDYESYEDCLDAQECDGMASLQTMLDQQSVAFDPVATADCHERLLADACVLGSILFFVPDLPEALAICGALTGQLSAGAACVSSVECPSELECNQEAGCPGVCEVPPNSDDLPEGAACVAEICIPEQEHCSQCAVGLECVYEICVPTPEVGDPCNGVLGCTSALWCDPATNQCAPLAELGEPCSDFRQVAANCVGDAWCDDPPASSTEAGVCRPISAAGQTCREDSNCAEPLVCLPTSADSTAFDPGVCGERQPNGSVCDSFDDCESDLCDAGFCVPQPALGESCIGSCAEGLVCEGSVCLQKRYAGEPCDATAYCQHSRCMDGVCTVRSRFGELCAEDDDCLSDHCDGVCIDPVGCGP